ncbi:intraflagellar transport protein 56-like isoform X2 [Panonychus citri]|uniref:intraflagellar transport protein 56-like isoform X2 n=1 Tax=Panonychus citri TaxID=50023 RepID=UPI0023077609|nr:intraflagellar transport protein 56-like isoform X2 [Panonychus citri]
MLLSRIKSSVSSKSIASNSGSNGSAKSIIPNLDDFLKNRDFTGALTLLKYNKTSGKDNLENEIWIGYCYFHLGEYSSALELYENIINSLPSNHDPNHGGSSSSSSVNITRDEVYLYIGCCQFLLGMYPECTKSLSLSVPIAGNQLRTRLEFHLAHKNGDEKTLIHFHQQLQDVLQDQLCLASIHYLRSHFQEAIDIYKKILLDHRDFLALNVYVALCYYKLDYYDVSQEVLAIYLQHYPDSVTAINLKACNHYRLYNGKAAENELRQLIDNSSPSFAYAKDLIRHNLVVFRNGEGAMQVLPNLVDNNIQEAFNLIKDLEPTVPHEYILKGVVNASYGQKKGLREFLKVAQQFFQLVGGSASECDTIPGRQCMASCFFLMKQFDDVLLYLSSIKSYFYSDDSFNFNFGQAQSVTGNYTEAEEAFLTIKEKRITTDPVYINWLIRCYIMNKTPEKAWQLYEQNSSRSDSYNYLNLIANDCYKMGQFLYSARAFDILEKHETNPEFWEGKRGACVGLFQLILAGKEPREQIYEIMKLLRNSDNPQVDQILRTLRNWDKENKSDL